MAKKKGIGPRSGGTPGATPPPDDPNAINATVEFSELDQREDPSLNPDNPNALSTTVRITGDATSLLRDPSVGVNLKRTRSEPTLDQGLWIAIRDRTDAIRFERYRQFLDRVLCRRQPDVPNIVVGPLREVEVADELNNNLDFLPAGAIGIGTYGLLKIATEAFLILECGVRIDGNDFQSLTQVSRTDRTITLPQAQALLTDYLGGANAGGNLPYLRRILLSLGFNDDVAQNKSAPFCTTSLIQRVNAPCLLELIWSYWHEEGMLVQTINAICMRFQNQRSADPRDPLAHLEIDPLRPLNNLLWGYVQDEYIRLSVKRRAYEYDHHYGLPLVGRAVNQFRPADSRSRFLEAFHDLLLRTARFYQEDSDTTVISNAFPLLNGLREVHLVLAEGAHNQFGDLPWTARVEMMIQQYLLARPEMREFLGGRIMVPYQEAWMGRVDTMKTLQGWTDVTVTHFRNLAVYGEQILLSIRYGDWIDVNDQDQARNWARFWRPEIEGYLHAYRATTGVDLTSLETVNATPPSVLLTRRLASQQRGPRPAVGSNGRAPRALPAAEPAPLSVPAPGRAGVPTQRRSS